LLAKAELLHSVHIKEAKMSYQLIIRELIKEGTVDAVLRKGSRDRETVRILQRVLYELGFNEELNWAKYGADGDYGNSTSAAVRAFAQRNGISASGEVVNKQIAQKILQRYDIIDDMRHIYNAIREKTLQNYYYRRSPHKTAVVALQVLLNELGYGKELNWDTYGADGYYGGSTTAALKAFAGHQGIRSDGEKLTQPLAHKILDELTPFYGENWTDETSTAKNTEQTITVWKQIESGKTRIYVSDGEDTARFTKFRKGVYTYGGKKTIDFVQNHRDELRSIGLSDSAIKVMIAVSENEGNLDAINTWDNSFMTFGMFQWTIGVGNDPGELPALVKKIKDADYAIYEKYFGDHGLDITNTGSVRGYFTLNGRKLDTPREKELLRTHKWAFNFWKAGQDAFVQKMEIKHAYSRLGTFYRSASYKVKGYYISDLVTSEYGVGLIIDNHVNRPGYVCGCLEKAMDRTRLSNPQNWGTQEERKLIHAYLDIRKDYGSYPMTHADSRAKVTQKYLDRGIISDERGSFRV
jgi:peptidoglycan hydrolase-like protein with peptidoglycan-binding domain